MAGLDLTTAEAKLAIWLDAEEKIASGQSISLDGRTLTRADLADVGKRIDFWDQRCKRLAGRSGRSGIVRVVNNHG